MANYGPANGYWRGGRTIASNGYVLIRVGKDTSIPKYDNSNRPRRFAHGHNMRTKL